MKQIARYVVLCLTACLFMLVVSGCDNKATTSDNLPAATAESAAHATASQQAQPTAEASGTVVETMDSGGYSYVLLDMDGEQVWAAGPVTADLTKGTKVYLDGAMKMQNFNSKTLDRTFESILFVAGIRKEGEAAPAGGGKPAGMPGMGHGGASDKMATNARTQLENAKVEAVAKAEGGYTVSEIYAKAADLAHQDVTIRARVVKFSANIMGTNWVHIQDGTGEDKTADLTITTSAVVQVGDVVLVKGRLSVDKDFGSGYLYHVIVEGASVSKE